MTTSSNAPNQRRGISRWVYGLCGCCAVFALGITVFVVAVVMPRINGLIGSHGFRNNSTFNGTTGTLRGTNGALIYDGAIQRKEVGGNYEYTVRNLKLQLNPIVSREEDAKTLGGVHMYLTRTANKSIEFLVTRKPTGHDGKGTWTTGFQKEIPLTSLWPRESSVSTVPILTFVVPKAKVAQADSVEFGITDQKGQFYPIGPGLK